MKKITSLLIMCVLVFACIGCGKDGGDEKSEGVMTYEEYMAVPTGDEQQQVVIEAYVQAKQSWWENKATVYAQDKDGAYFLYDMACSEEDYAKLTP